MPTCDCAGAFCHCLSCSIQERQLQQPPWQKLAAVKIDAACVAAGGKYAAGKRIDKVSDSGVFMGVQAELWKCSPAMDVHHWPALRRLKGTW